MSEKKDEELDWFSKPEYSLALMTVYVQVQTTWAVLILAFLTGLLTSLGLVDPRNWVLSLPIIGVYIVLSFGLSYAAKRFLLAISKVKELDLKFHKQFPYGLEWNAGFYDKRLFSITSNDEVKVNGACQSILLFCVIMLFMFALIARIF